MSYNVLKQSCAFVLKHATAFQGAKTTRKLSRHDFGGELRLTLTAARKYSLKFARSLVQDFSHSAIPSAERHLSRQRNQMISGTTINE